MKFHTHYAKWNLCHKFPCSWLSPPPSCGPAVWLWGELSLFVPLFFCLVTPDQAADDHVKIKITKYKTGHSPDGEVKVQELGEGDPQWKHIKDVVKEQLEKAGLKPEGTKKGESLKGSLPFCVSHLWIFLSSSTTTLWLSESGFPNLLTDKMIMLWQKDIRQVKGGEKKKSFSHVCTLCFNSFFSFYQPSHIIIICLNIFIWTTFM